MTNVVWYGNLGKKTDGFYFWFVSFRIYFIPFLLVTWYSTSDIKLQQFYHGGKL